MKKNYTISQEKCTYCGGCASLCPVMAITIEDRYTEIKENCVTCGNCYDFCPLSAVEEGNDAV